MELRHEFTVPATVEETWAAFNDIESVAACFPGATVTSVEGDTFQGSCKVKLGPIALVYNGSGTFVEKDESARRMVIDAKGKDKRGNGTAGAHVTATMTEEGTGTQGRGAHRPGHHRQARAVRPRGDAGRQRQAARPVHRLPGAEGGRRGSRAESGPEPATRARHRSDRGRPAAPERRPRPPQPRRGQRPRHRRRRRPGASGDGGDDALDLGATVLPVLLKSYWKQALGVLVVLLVLRRLLRR